MNISRRAIAKGAVWAAPVIAATSQIPSYAASSICQNDAATPTGVTYKLIGADGLQTTSYQNGVQLNLSGDGRTTWSENPGYEVTFTYRANRDLGETVLRAYISGSYYNGGNTHEGRVANVIDKSFANGTGYTYTMDTDGSNLTNVDWRAGQIGQIRDAATAAAATLPDGAYAGYGINHQENEKIFAAYDSGQVAGELRLTFDSIKAGTNITFTVYSRFAEPNNYKYMAQEFGLGSEWHRPILNAGMSSGIHFKESGNRGDANGGYCFQLQNQYMAIFDGDLTTEKNTNIPDLQ